MSVLDSVTSARSTFIEQFLPSSAATEFLGFMSTSYDSFIKGMISFVKGEYIYSSPSAFLTSLL
jgi:hypothetical protein